MDQIKSTDDFKTYVETQKAQSWWREPFAFAIARVDYGASGNPVTAMMPVINWAGENQGSLAVLLSVLAQHGVDMDGSESELVVPFSKDMASEALSCFAPFIGDVEGHKNIQVVKQISEISAADNFGFKLVVLFEDAPCQSLETAYLKLIAMSDSYAKPHSLNLDGIFGILPNLAWAGQKPYELDELRARKIEWQLSGQYPHIDYVDKFPRFLRHVIPADNTRILETGKVRLGAYLAGGTTVMPGASYINFNAGTLGASMVEGRISSSATVGAGTDVGGGASILGVLSGGNATPISIGKNCLLGANSVCGIPLGDSCIIDAGVTVLAGSKLAIRKTDVEALTAVNESALPENDNGLYKAADLSGMNGVHFRTDTTNGQLVAFRSKYEIKLNEDLH